MRLQKPAMRRMIPLEDKMRLIGLGVRRMFVFSHKTWGARVEIVITQAPTNTKVVAAVRVLENLTLEVSSAMRKFPYAPEPVKRYGLGREGKSQGKVG